MIFRLRKLTGETQPTHPTGSNNTNQTKTFTSISRRNKCKNSNAYVCDQCAISNLSLYCYHIEGASVPVDKVAQSRLGVLPVRVLFLFI